MKSGDRFRRRGQSYLFATWKPHLTRDGRRISLAVLVSKCAEPECGEDFVQAVTRGAIKRGELSRRCKRHQQPGRAVDGGASRAAKQKAGSAGRRSPQRRKQPRRPPSPRPQWEIELIG